MIYVIDSLNQSAYSTLLHDMFRLRKRVFHDRLGWDVQITDGLETDLFDDLDPAHVVSVDDDGNVVGCMRLLQTTGPHMLADVFSSILDGEPPLRSSTVWEATRFCVDTQRLSRGRGRNTISYVTSEVMIGAFEFAMTAGVQDAVAVIDPVMNRVLQRSGNAPYGYLGSAKPMGKVVALAALMDCSEQRVASIRAFAGIEGNIFAQQDMTIAAE
jgi:acyl homoserine lactone synthase